MMSVRRSVCHIGDGRHFWRGVSGVSVASVGFWLQVRMAWAPAELCHQVGGQMPGDYLVGLKTLVMPWRRVMLKSKRGGTKLKDLKTITTTRPRDEARKVGRHRRVIGHLGPPGTEHQSRSQH